MAHMPCGNFHRQEVSDCEVGTTLTDVDHEHHRHHAGTGERVGLSKAIYTCMDIAHYGLAKAMAHHALRMLRWQRGRRWM